jgi:hypothetical protein
MLITKPSATPATNSGVVLDLLPEIGIFISQVFLKQVASVYRTCHSVFIGHFKF